jgi:hypothetical protein
MNLEILDCASDKLVDELLFPLHNLRINEMYTFRFTVYIPSNDSRS